MKLKPTTVTTASSVSIDVRDMLDKQFAVVTRYEPEMFFGSLAFKLVGEIIYRDYAGWHGLTDGRFWPSTGHVYVPNMRVRLLNAGELLEVTE